MSFLDQKKEELLTNPVGSLINFFDQTKLKNEKPTKL